MEQRNAIKKLYIIGNGFDRYHGADSSYADFKNYLLRADRCLAKDLDFFIDSPELWGDFENNLAQLSREKLMTAVEVYTPNLEPYDEGFSVADFEIAIEQATGRIYRMTGDLQFRFYKWIRQIYLPKGHKKKKLTLDPTAFYINFNYTPFLETLYELSSNQILYLHGSAKGKPKSIVLGHSESETNSNLDKWKAKEIKTAIKNGSKEKDDFSRMGYLAYFATEEEYWRNITETQHLILERVVPAIETYFEDSYKNTKEVIGKHAAVFEKLNNLKEIEVMGHSLSVVDLSYFQHLIDINRHPDKIDWSISYYSEKSKERIEDFRRQMQIQHSQIKLFKLEEKRESL